MRLAPRAPGAAPGRCRRRRLTAAWPAARRSTSAPSGPSCWSPRSGT
jgi:hypothetical protein